jgi:hypothetical protein
VAAGASWLASVPWRVFASLTFRTVPSEREALAALRAWLRVVALHFETHVPYAYAAALDGSAGEHFHVLLDMGRPLSRRERRWLEAAWRIRHGFARVGAYKPDAGAEGYLLRHPTWDRNVACPRPPRCRRARGCVEAPGSWT